MTILVNKYSFWGEKVLGKLFVVWEVITICVLKLYKSFLIVNTKPKYLKTNLKHFNMEYADM